MIQDRCCFKSVVILLATIGLVIGCGDGAASGPPRATISGKITLDGKPIGGGEIRFVPSNGAQSVSRVSVDGTYSINSVTDGPVVGTNKVFIEWFRDSGKKDDEGNMIPEIAIPAKYNLSTTLSVEVISGKNTHNFDLQSK